jgi:hypothetical protein
MVRKSWLVPFVLVFFVGCMGVGTKPWSARTPEEKLLYFMSIYNSAYANYEQQAARPDLTLQEALVLRIKRDTLVELHKLISIYDKYVQTGQIEGWTLIELEQQIFNLMDKLARKQINE